MSRNNARACACKGKRCIAIDAICGKLGGDAMYLFEDGVRYALTWTSKTGLVYRRCKEQLVETEFHPAAGYPAAGFFLFQKPPALAGVYV